jgi:hypothetical protein
LQFSSGKIDIITTNVALETDVNNFQDVHLLTFLPLYCGAVQRFKNGNNYKRFTEPDSSYFCA